MFLRAFAHMKRVGPDWSLTPTRFNPEFSSGKSTVPGERTAGSRISAGLGKQAVQFARLIHFHHDVGPADKFALHI